MNQSELSIELINEKSPYLRDVIALGDANTATLGFFPEKAFYKSAANSEIICAFNSRKEFAGYLLYRTSYDRVTIVHLCINPADRRKKVTRKLVDYLKQITQSYSGIGLHCRRDYNLNKMWSKLGFIAKYDKPAKTPDKLLTFWWLDYNHPNLLSQLSTQQRESKLCVIIDYKIFSDLFLDEEINTKEAKSLLADWLQPNLELCVIDEIYNLINNVNDSEERKRQQIFAQKLTFLEYLQAKLETVEQQLKAFFINNLNEYEQRYLAKAIAADTQIFITQNPLILEKENEFYHQFKLSLKTPVELIFQLDDLSRKPEYQPVRLAGTELIKRKITSGEEDSLNKFFLADKQGETQGDFQQRLRRFLTETDKFDTWLILENKQPIALFVYDRYNQDELKIPLLRVSKNPLSPTITHHLIFQLALLSAQEKCSFTRITDLYLPKTVTKAIQADTCFIKIKNDYLRANIALVDTKQNLAQHLINLNIRLRSEYDFCSQIADTLKQENIGETILRIEQLLFPAKIIDADIPNFIIPIKPQWAQNLFDEELANQTLFGCQKISLALNREAVYYKSKKAPKNLKPGVIGRILWYVSLDKDKGYNRVKAIRACSRLDEVIIDKPKNLYSLFRDLGIYELKNVFNVANNNPEKDIMAIRFSDTELFKKPVPLQKIQQVLNKQMTMQSPINITPESFAIIYKLGSQKNN